MFLINLPELESETTSTSSYSIRRLKTGDIGEMLFDLECARLNIAPFRPALSNGSIDRLILLPSGETKKVHIKTSLLHNSYASTRTNCKRYVYTFLPANCITKADYYFFCGLDDNYRPAYIWWIPWSLSTTVNIPSDGYGFEPYLRNPFEEFSINKGPVCR